MAMPEAARVRRRAHLALFDATTLAAKGVKDHLVARSFPAASVRLFTSSPDPDSNLTEFKGEPMLVTSPDIDTLQDLDIAFLCGSRADGARYLDWAGRVGFVAVDLTGAAGASRGVPLVNASVNPEAIGEGPGVIATPHPVAQILSTLLAPVRKRCGLLEAVAVVLQPASHYGEPGIDELHQQAASLMNFKEMPKEIFGRQLAFNLMPDWLRNEPRGEGAGRADLEEEVLRITGGGYALGVQVIQAPVFHGHAAMVHLLLEAGRGPDDLAACFSGSDEIRFERRGDRATPVERAGEAGILVGGIRPGRRESAFWIWAVSDDLAGGTALNAVRIAEALLDRGNGRGRA
ncbi:MAG: Asd/ArgC dimerization domain-containing protein [Acidobacteriota bacterium]